jgi:putative tryptophan/tyrosine transport system substrate-binding protein
MPRMKRREFITLLGSATAAWPLAARAQRPDRVRRLGLLTNLGDAGAQGRIGPFLEELERLGWTEGRNIQIDKRIGAANVDAIRKHAAELVALAPDVILAVGTIPTASLIQTTRTVPIVFTLIIDPLGGGLVDDLARPSGNVTGFMVFEYSLSSKWLELLKQVAPSVTRAAVLRDPASPAGTGQFAVIQSVAPSFGVELRPINVRDPREIEQAVAAFARSANGGLVVTANPQAADHHDLIITLAARHKLPAIYFERYFAAAGGLISYGPNFNDEFRRAAGYVDRILKGEKPADLPVQAPTKYELIVNLKTAKALDLTVPPTLLARANEVIE